MDMGRAAAASRTPMPLSLRTLAVATATLAAACSVALPARAAPAGCGASAYSYAGLQGVSAVSGVGARLTAVRRPRVTIGHVAGWVGVGGAGMGPGSTDEWLQVGISATDTAGIALYYELALPHAKVRYVMLRGHIPVGKAYDVAVLEAQGHPGSWRVWVNGSAVTRPIYLAGSHGAWPPVATSESWNGDMGGTCNTYTFRFEQVRVATKPGGAWEPFTAGQVLSAPGYHLSRKLDTLLAVGGA
jgi:hypothetical protein